MNRLYKWIALWVPVLAFLELAALSLSSNNPTIQTLWGTAAIGAALFGAACQAINHRASKDNQ